LKEKLFDHAFKILKRRTEPDLQGAAHDTRSHIL